MKNIYLQIPLSQPDISDLVLATVTGTSGSTPQKAGSSALFNKSGLVSGTVGGGILEGRVQQIAIESIITKKPGHLLFHLDKSITDGEDALCGGKIKVLVDPDLSRHFHVFNEIKHSIADRIPGILITSVTDSEGERVVINRYWLTSGNRTSLPGEITSRFEPEITNLLSFSKQEDFREIPSLKQDDRSSFSLFLEPIIPPLRLIIAGAGHIGKALSTIGQMLDFEVTVIDDRPEFANSENIQHADHIITGDIGDSIARIGKGSDTFFVIVTRGHMDDAKALRACIGSDAAYVGMIGSRNKVALMRKDFISNGWSTEDQWNRIFAPIGLDIKSRTVEEIAISIAAQLVQVKNTQPTLIRG